MRRFACLFIAAILFGFLPSLERLAPFVGAPLFILLTVLFAVAVSDAPGSLAVASGAAGGFAAGMLHAVAPAAAGALAMVLCFGPRSLRVRQKRLAIGHAVLSVVAGGVAGALTSSFAAASLAIFSVAVVMAAVLVCLPLLIEADDPIAHTLGLAAAEMEGPPAEALGRAANLRRASDEAILDRKVIPHVRATWASLVRLAEARLRLIRSPTKGAPSGPAEVVLRKLDSKIDEHVAALERTYAAVSAVKAAEASLDDSALRGVEGVGESLEHVSRTIVGDDPP